MSSPRKEQLAEGVTVWLGDCREIVPEIGEVTAVVTDPPYGNAYRSGHATEKLWAAGPTITGDESPAVRDECLRTWRGSSVPRIVFGSRKVRPPSETRMVLIWDKGPALGMGALDLPWKPSYEEIYILGARFVGRRDEGAVIYCPPVQSMACNGRVHPNQKPVQLLKRLLMRCPPGLTLDPFMGSGTTGVACVDLAREFVGIEVETPYFDIACHRISEALKRPRLPFDEPAPEPSQALLFEASPS